MDSSVSSYLSETFKNIRQLHSSDKGEVWLAADTVGKLVVIKHILMTGLPYKELKEHPLPVCPKILFCSEDEDETVVVEEFVQGDSLIERLEQKQYLTEQEAVSILLQLCDGLSELHKHGIIHRDIKPSNLILQNGGIVRLIDFDAARIIKDGCREDTRLLGTKGYAPPEQFGYGQTDARSDIYAIGVTMQKMLGSEYRGFLSGILEKCTKLDPQQRYTSVLALKKAILFGSRRMLYFAIAAVILFIAGIGIYSAQGIWIPEDNVNEVRQDTTETVEAVNGSDAVKADPVNQNIPVEIKENAAVSNPEISKPGEDIINESTHQAVGNTPVGAVNAPLPEKPVSIPVPNQPMETGIYVNGTAINPLAAGEIQLELDEWKDSSVNLEVVNNTNTVWEDPSINIVFRDNWGSEYTETKSLPSAVPGETINFNILLDSYPITNHIETSSWLQVYLDTGSIPCDENYWCVQFLVHGTQPAPQDIRSKSK